MPKRGRLDCVLLLLTCLLVGCGSSKDKGINKDLVIDRGSSLEFGARPLRRAIEHLLEDPLAEKLLQGHFEGKDTITVTVGDVDGEKKLVFEASNAAPRPEMATAIKEGS